MSPPLPSTAADTVVPAPTLPKRRHCLQLGMAGLLGSAHVHAAPAATETVLRYPAPRSPMDHRSQDLINLLDAVLRRTEATDGPVRLEPSAGPLNEPRQFIELDADRSLLHVTYATPSILRRTRHACPV